MDDSKVSVALLLFIVFYFLLSSLKGRIAKRSHKGPAIYPIIGSAYELVANRHRFLQWLTRTLQKMPTKTFLIKRPGGVTDVCTADPANVEYMLKTNFENYPKGERFTTLLHDFLGRGIFNADGELWKMQRKTASYEFNTKSLRSFVVETVQWEISNRLVPVLTNAAKTGESLDLQDILQRFGFDNICRVAFGVDPACLLPSMPISPFAKAFHDATDLSAGRFFYCIPFLWRVKRMLNIGSERCLRRALLVVDEFASEVVSCRRKQISVEHPQRNDLLSRFIALLLDNSNRLDIDVYLEGDREFNGAVDILLKEMVVSFVLAGRDSTSVALTWFFWLLSSHPSVEESIHTEILQVLGKRSRAQTVDEEGVCFSFEELKDMRYLHAALCESMRLYPPVPVDTKYVSRDDVLPDGTCVRKGWNLSYSSYAMGRMESIWGSDCLQFKPERWLIQGEFAGDNPYKFPVFHAGPRVCLGKEMAFIQMKSVVASIIHSFHFEVEDGITCPDYVVSLTMRMRGGLPVTVAGR